jgi:hypothetical protein
MSIQVQRQRLQHGQWLKVSTEARMVFIIMIVSLASHFHRNHSVTENYVWESLADSKISSFRSWSTSCTLFFPSISTSEDLYIYWNGFSKPHWNDDLGNRHWFELLRLFSTVKNLYLSKEFTKHVAPAQQELVVGGMHKCCRTCRIYF